MTILLWCLKASVSLLIAKYYQRFALIGIQNPFKTHSISILNKKTNKQTKDGYYSYIILYGNWSDVQF